MINKLNLNNIIEKISVYKKNLVIKNSFFNLIQFFVPIILILLFTPVFIKKMGTASYGLWMLAISVLGFISMAEFGLNTAVSKFIAEFVTNDDFTDLSSVVSIATISYIALALILIIPLYLFSPELARLFKSSKSVSLEQVRVVIRIISLGFIPLLFKSGAMAIPIGLQKYQIPVAVTILNQILTYTFALLVVFVGGSVVDVVKSSVFVLTVSAIISLIIAFRMLKPFCIKINLHFSKIIAKRMFFFTLMSGISGIGTRIFSFADRIAVGSVLGLDAVAYYTVIVSIASKILQFSGVLTMSLMPAVSTWISSGSINKVKDYFFKSTKILVFFNLLLVMVVLIISKPFLTIWLGGEFTSLVLFPFRILVLIYAVISINSPAYHVLNGIGHPWVNALTAISGGLLTVFFIYFLGDKIGLIGVTLANIGYVFTFYQFWRVIKYFGKFKGEKQYGK